MSQPSKENIEVSLRALREESAQWTRISESLAPIAPFVSGTQDLSAVQMGIFAPAHSAYHHACTVVATVADTGTKETQRISDLLANIADTYEREEEVNVGQAESIHQQLGKW